MQVTLKKQICGHVAGAVVGVSDDRAYLWMVQGIALPDKKFLTARKKETDKLLKKAKNKIEPKPIAKPDPVSEPKPIAKPDPVSEPDPVPTEKRTYKKRY